MDAVLTINELNRSVALSDVLQVIDGIIARDNRPADALERSRPDTVGRFALGTPSSDPVT